MPQSLSSRPAVILLDDGGVMNDNAIRNVEWQRLVGEFLAPRLGGAPEAWGEANRVVFDRQWARFEAWLVEVGADGFGDFFAQRSERVRWLHEMCEHAAIEAPPESECYRLACETEGYVLPRVRATFPGAVEAIRALAATGFRLGTASGHTSGDLEASLAIMGVREQFSLGLYGPDLVGVLKNGPEYYRRIFADAGVAPGDVLVVDDSPRATGWAAEAGASAMFVSRDAAAGRRDGLVIGSLAELPALLGR